MGEIINSTKKEINFNYKNYFIADVNNANGADVAFVEQLFKQKTDNFFGYCAYNTSANTIGCAILSALVKFIAIKNNSYNDNAFRKLQFIRFLDDWGYQAISRKYIRETETDFNTVLLEKEEELNKNAQKISEFLNFYPKKINYSLAWNRSFEIRIQVE